MQVASKFGVSLETVQESVLAHLKNDETNSPADQYSVAYQLTIDNMNLQSKVIFRTFQPIRCSYFRIHSKTLFDDFLFQYIYVKICHQQKTINIHSFLVMINYKYYIQAPDFYAAPRKQSSSQLNLAKPHPERMAQLLDSGPADNVGQSTKSGTGLDGRGVDLRENQRPKRPKSKWHLGIRSQSNHQHVMKEVYR